MSNSPVDHRRGVLVGMKALLLTEYRQLSIEDVEKPSFSDDDILVRVEACGICGSDVHGYDGSSGRRIPPLVMGHEAAGVVDAVGKNVSQFQPGDRVTFDSTVYCGECQFCQRDQVNLCDNRMVLGVSCDDFRRYGAFAEFVAVPQRIAYQLPPEIPFEHAALIEAVSVAVHAVGRVPDIAGSTVLVVGSGMIGLLVVQALRAAGCRRILAVDQDNDRLELAKNFGADEVYCVTDESPVEWVRSVTAGQGVDAAWEVVGATPTVTAAIESVRKGGAVTLVGNLAPQVEVPLQAIVTRELTLYGSCASNGEYPECIRLMSSGAINVAPLISATAPLEEGPAWFERLYSREPGLMKVVLKP